MSLTEDLRSKAKELGADLVGIAPIERFEGAPKLYHPQNLLPQTKLLSVSLYANYMEHLLRRRTGLSTINTRPMDMAG